jgi:hypothetical protein
VTSRRVGDPLPAGGGDCCLLLDAAVRVTEPVHPALPQPSRRSASPVSARRIAASSTRVCTDEPGCDASPSVTAARSAAPKARCTAEPDSTCSGAASSNPTDLRARPPHVFGRLIERHSGTFVERHQDRGRSNAMRVNEQDRQLHSAPTSTKCQDRHLQPAPAVSAAS